MTTHPSYRSLFVIDVENSRSLDDRFKQVMRTALYESVRTAFREVGIDWDHCGHENLGDGILVVIPPTVDKVPIVDQLTGRLQVALHQHNTTAGKEAPVRARVALHAGEVTRDGEGWSGADLDHVFALSKDDVLRRVLARSTRTDLALILSRTIYEAVVRHGFGPPDLAFVHPVEVAGQPAWIWVPGYRNPPGLDEPAPGPAPAGDGGPGTADATAGPGTADATAGPGTADATGGPEADPTGGPGTGGSAGAHSTGQRGGITVNSVTAGRDVAGRDIVRRNRA